MKDIIDNLPEVLNLNTVEKILALKSPIDFTEDYVSDEELETLLSQIDNFNNNDFNVARQITYSIQSANPTPVETDYV